MNKIKLLYDVVQTMRAKDTVKGTVNVEVQKDGENVLAVKKDFEKDMASELVKVKISSEMNNEGKQVKHESTTEFHSGQGCHSRHHEIFRHIHAHHSEHGGLKDRLTKLAFGLRILDIMEAENSEDNRTVISLDLEDIPEEIRTLCREKRERFAKIHPGECWGMDCCSIEKDKLEIKIYLNEDNEVEKIVAFLSGIKTDEQNERHNIAVDAALKFTW